MSRVARVLVAFGLGLVLTSGAWTQPGIASAESGLQSRIDSGSAYATGRGTTIALAVLDRATGEYRDNGGAAHTRVESASVVKVLIADNLLRRRDLGQITLSATDLSDMSRMLRSSDNAPANRFWSSYGANGIVSEVIARYGLSETGLTSNIRYWGNTLITAHDMVLYYKGLLAGSGGLSSGSRSFLIDQLQRSTQLGSDGYDQFFGLRRGLPGEQWIGQKQGWMCCVNGSVYRHSTGFVGPEGRYVVVALSKEPSDRGAAHLEESLSGAVARMFPEGRVALGQPVDPRSRARSGAEVSSEVGGLGNTYYLNNAFDGAADVVVRYGDVRDDVYVGDWDGNGTDTLAVRRGNTFYLDDDTSGGTAEVVFDYGDAADAVFVGDWDGNGTDTLAVRRGNTLYLKNDTRTGVADTTFSFGDAGDTILVGDWDGNRADTLAVRRGATYFVRDTLSSGPADRSFEYGNPDDQVLVGRWSTGQAADSLTVRRGSTYYVRNSTQSGTADAVFAYGEPTDTSFQGDWDGDGVDGIGVRRP